MNDYIELHGPRANEHILISINSIKSIEEMKPGARRYPVMDIEQSARSIIYTTGSTYPVKESYRQIKNILKKCLEARHE